MYEDRLKVDQETALNSDRPTELHDPLYWPIERATYWKLGTNSMYTLYKRKNTMLSNSEYIQTKTVQDLINHINMVGYHDICNYPIIPANAVGVSNDKKIKRKHWRHGLYVFFGYDKRNGTAANLFEILLRSRKDDRFRQFLRCYSILYRAEQKDVLQSFMDLEKLSISTHQYYSRNMPLIVLRTPKTYVITTVQERIILIKFIQM